MTVTCEYMQGNGETALLRAVSRGNAEMISLLVSRQADVNGRDVSNSRSNSSFQIQKLLQGEGATALHRVEEMGDRNITHLLLEIGMDVNAQEVSSLLPFFSGRCDYRCNPR